MVQTAVGVALTDPMHLEGWEEQDEPLATDLHGEEQAYCWTALRSVLNPDGHYVSKDRWLRMDPADPADRLLPDILIALHVQAQQWNVNEYLPWEVGKAPEVLGEFLSPTSVRADKVEKPKRYGELGVREYFLFDPDGTYRVPRIQGWTLRHDGSQEALPCSGGGVQSRVLPVRFVLTDNHIGVVDTRTGQLALRYAEMQRLLRQELALRYQAEQREAVARQQEAAYRQQGADARAAAEAEVARLRAELDRLRQTRNGDGGA